MNIAITVIKSRRSVRKFKDTPIPEEVVRNAIECALLAPTARNEQPWLIGKITDPALLKKIAALTDNGRFIADCRICFTVFGKKDAKYCLEDCSAATTQLILGLWAYGVGSCWVAGDKKPYAEDVRRLLNVPEDYKLISMVAAGYPADVPVVKKKDAKETTFSERYSS
ncbi:MAG: nitroreductase family protein [Methanomicrobiales archaeon]|nr:nitroreductase family protein [Methanomicrobiales archaeon]